MKKLLPLGLIFLCTFINLYAQKVEWKAGLDYFFDNTEYAKSTLTKDQTMTGVHFTPEIGMSFDSVHAFFAGVDLLKTAGSQNIIDIAQPIAYYRYQNRKVSFYAGAFSRSELLSNYSDLFFQDSVNYYRPTIQGFFWQMGKNNAFFNFWLDWTGHQTAVNRESFFIGASAYKKSGLFFVDFQSYMFHFATTRPNPLAYNVNDNLLGHLSVGANYSNQSGLDTLLLAVGVLAGVERDRILIDGTHTPVGVVIRLNACYKGFGTQNTMYAGQPRDVFYDKFGTDFYWNNPFLRSGFYLESKWYLDVIRSQFVTGKLNMNFQFSQGKMMVEQVLTVNAQLDSFRKNKVKIKPTFFSSWFK